MSIQPRCGSDAHVLACAASAWSGDKRACRWCNAELTGRQQRWCSSACAGLFGANHWWTSASRAAKERDSYHCTVCPPPTVVLDMSTPRARYEASMRRIAVQVHHLKPLHTLTITVKEWVREAMADRQYDRPVTHADSGCWHHLDGLVTLCKPHHLEAHAELEQERRMPGQARLL